MKQLKRRLLSKKKLVPSPRRSGEKSLAETNLHLFLGPKWNFSAMIHGLTPIFFLKYLQLLTLLRALFQNLEVKFLGLPLFSKRLAYCDFIIPAKFTGQFILMWTFHIFISQISFRKQGSKVCLIFFEPNLIFYSTWAQIHHANSFDLQGEEGQPQKILVRDEKMRRMWLKREIVVVVVPPLDPPNTMLPRVPREYFEKNFSDSWSSNGRNFL